jgi:hypothetical protein
MVSRLLPLLTLLLFAYAHADDRAGAQSPRSDPVTQTRHAEGKPMKNELQYQVRMVVSQDLADAYRDGRDTPALARLRDALRAHHATITSQYDAFAGYVKQAEKDGTQDYPLYQWTLDTIRDPAKQAKYQRVFTVYVNDQEVYGERVADALVAEISALGMNAGVESISKLDTNPANSPQPPKAGAR